MAETQLYYSGVVNDLNHAELRRMFGAMLTVVHAIRRVQLGRSVRPTLWPRKRLADFTLPLNVRNGLLVISPSQGLLTLSA